MTFAEGQNLRVVERHAVDVGADGRTRFAELGVMATIRYVSAVGTHYPYQIHFPNGAWGTYSQQQVEEHFGPTAVT